MQLKTAKTSKKGKKGTIVRDKKHRVMKLHMQLHSVGSDVLGDIVEDLDKELLSEAEQRMQNRAGVAGTASPFTDAIRTRLRAPKMTFNVTRVPSTDGLRRSSSSVISSIASNSKRAMSSARIVAGAVVSAMSSARIPSSSSSSLTSSNPILMPIPIPIPTSSSTRSLHPRSPSRLCVEGSRDVCVNGHEEGSRDRDRDREGDRIMSGHISPLQCPNPDDDSDVYYRPSLTSASPLALSPSLSPSVSLYLSPYISISSSSSRSLSTSTPRSLSHRFSSYRSPSPYPSSYHILDPTCENTVTPSGDIIQPSGSPSVSTSPSVSPSVRVRPNLSLNLSHGCDVHRCDASSNRMTSLLSVTISPIISKKPTPTSSPAISPRVMAITPSSTHIL